jgi:hypothetical protein
MYPIIFKTPCPYLFGVASLLFPTLSVPDCLNLNVRASLPRQSQLGRNRTV